MQLFEQNFTDEHIFTTKFPRMPDVAACPKSTVECEAFGPIGASWRKLRYSAR